MTGRAALTRTGGVVRRCAEPAVAAIRSSLAAVVVYALLPLLRSRARREASA
jgi:hypothetical protein